MKMLNKKANKIIIIIALISYFPTSYATERIDILSQQTKFGTIVRDAGKDNSIICDQTGAYTGSPSFIYYKIGSSSNANSLHLSGVDTIFDFEIFDNVVYFCGVKNNTTGGYGVLGYFSLTGFPYTTVKYLNVPLFRRLKRIEVGNMAGSTHMVAVGDGIQDYAVLVDAVDNGGTWTMNFLNSEDNDYKFVDLAITESYVVVISYVFENITYSARAINFAKPTIPGGTLSPISVQWVEVCSQASPYMRIEACEKDTYVVVVANGVNLIGTSGFTIAAYNYVGHISTNFLSEPYDRVYLNDIVYDKTSKMFELLFYFKTDSSKFSVIYNLIPAMESGNVTASGHLYNDVDITSLDLSGNNLYHVIATGIHTTSLNYIAHFLYHYALWDNCMEQHYNLVTKISPPIRQEFLDIGLVSIEQVPKEITESEKSVPTLNLCME